MSDGAAGLLAATSSALLVVDIQNDYVHPEGAVGRRGFDTSPVIEMMPRLHSLIDTARNAGIPIYFTRTWYGPHTERGPWRSRRERTAGAGGFAGQAGSWGAGWFEIEPRPDEAVIDKYRYDAFLGTPLEMILRQRGIQTVVCCGTATNVCVESTARSAHMRDFNLILVGDCCGAAAVDQKLHEATLENIRKYFGYVASSDEIKAAWTPNPAELAGVGHE